MSRLILAGAGHGHLPTLARLRTMRARGHSISVVSPSEFHYYSGLGPSILSGRIQPAQARFPVARTVRRAGCRFILDRVTGLDPAKRLVFLASGQELPYDVLSFNIGSGVAPLPQEDPSVPVIPVKPIEHLHSALLRLQELAAQPAPRIVIVGGGAAGVEIAGSARELLGSRFHADPDITLLAGSGLLKRFPPTARALARGALLRQGIRILEGPRAVKINGNSVFLDTGASLNADFIFLASGVRPPGLFSDCGLPTGPQGGLTVNSYLQSAADPRIFGTGDCIHFADQPLDKVGVYAVTQGSILAHNLQAALESRPLQPYSPQRRYMLILNLGDGTGLLTRNGLNSISSSWLHLKNHIDLKFMNKFL